MLARLQKIELSLFSILPTPPTARRPFYATEANETAGTVLKSFFGM